MEVGSSNKSLWILVSGASLTSTELIGTELQANLTKISSGLNFYLPPNPKSAKSLQDDAKVDANICSIITQLSKFMNLDEKQCYEIFCDFLLYEYRGSDASLQTVIGNERLMQKCMLQIWDYYRCERLYLLLTLKEVLSHCNDQSHPYFDLFNEFIQLVDQDKALNTSLLSQWESLLKAASSISKMQTSFLIDEQTRSLITFTLREQCELLQLMFIYYKEGMCDAAMFLKLLTSIKNHGFGWRQLNSYLLDDSLQPLLQSIAYLECLILLRILNVPSVRENDDRSEPYFLAVDTALWKKADHAMCHLGTQSEHGPLMLAWAIVRHHVLGDEGSTVTRSLGNSALDLGTFTFVNLLLQNPVFQGAGTVATYARSVIYHLFSTLLTQFDENSLGNNSVIHEIIQRLLKDSGVAKDFWSQGIEMGLGNLLHSDTQMFPYSFSPLVDLLSSLAEASSSSAAKVVLYLNELPCLTLLQTPQMPYKELWNRNGRPLELTEDYYPFETETVCVTAGTLGTLLIDDKENSVIQWQQAVNGWQVSLAIVNRILQEMNSGAGVLAPESLNIISSLSWLIRNLLKSDSSLAANLGLLIEQIFLVLQRFPELRQPPVGVIASCLNLAASVDGASDVVAMWSRVVQSDILPLGLSPVTCLSDFVDVEFSRGAISFLIASCECVAGEYPVTLAFLNLLSAFAAVLVNKEDSTFSTSVAFVAREIFPSHSRWWYRNPEEKEQIAQRCLNIFHRVLQTPSAEWPKEAKKMGMLSGVTLRYLVQQESSRTLLLMICTGEEAINQALKKQVSWISGHGIELLSTVKLALSVLSRLLVLWRDGTKEHSPLAYTLCSDPHTIRTVANYVYHRFDPRLATLGIFLMKRFARELPISLLVCLGPEAATFCKLLLLRLESRAEDIHIKNAILEFLSACVDCQPGMTEAFIGNLQDDGTQEESEQLIPKSKCLRLVVRILRHYQQEPCFPEELRSSALLFLKSLWIGRQTLALHDIRACPDLWDIIFQPLLKENLTAHSKASEFTVTILAQEFLFLKLSARKAADQLSANLQKLSSASTILEWTKSVCDRNVLCEGTDDGPSITASWSLLSKTGVEGLLRAWKDFLVVGVKTKLLTVTAPEKMVDAFLDALIGHFHLGCTKSCAGILSEASLHLARLWPRTDVGASRKIDYCTKLLNAMIYAGDAVASRVITNVLAFCIVEVSSTPEGFSVVADHLISGLLGTVCQITNCSALATEKVLVKSCDGTLPEVQFQINILCTTLLQKCTGICKDSDVWLFHTRNSPVVTSLLNLLSLCLRYHKAPEVCQATLQLLTCLGGFDTICENLLSVGIVQTLCLPLARLKVFESAEAVTHGCSFDKISWSDVYAMGINLITCILQSQRHFVLDAALNFSSVHLSIFQMIPSQFQKKYTAGHISMTTSVVQFIHELSHYSSFWKLHSLASMREVLKIISSVCYGSIAYLLRPQLIRVLLEGKSGANISLESMKEENQMFLKRMSSTEEFDRSEPKVADAFRKLLQLAYLCISILYNFSPDLCEFLSEPGYDVGQWDELLEVGFGTPSVDQMSGTSFGTIISSAGICLRILSGGDRSSSPAISLSAESGLSNRQVATSLLEKSLCLILSQASIIILNANLPSWDKQLFKRELGSELDPFVQSRYLKRGSSAPSPVSSFTNLVATAPGSPKQQTASLSTDKSPFICLILALIEILFR